MAMPTGALDVTSDTTHPLSIDLEAWNKYNAEGTPTSPLYMYVASRVPISPGETMNDRQIQPCRFRVGYSSVGNDDATYTAKIHRDLFGNDTTSLHTATLAGAAACYVTSTPTNRWPGYPSADFARYGVVEIAARHANPTVTQDTYEWLGLCAWWYADDQDPLYTDRVDVETGNKDSSAPSNANEFASAYGMMSCFALTLNTYTHMNSGGFGCGVFAVPMFGYPEPT